MVFFQTITMITISGILVVYIIMKNDARSHQKSLVNKGFKDCYVVRLKGNKKL